MDTFRNPNQGAMDPQIWSKMPLELLRIVIGNTLDNDSLSWSLTCRQMHNQAVQKLGSTMKIGEVEIVRFESNILYRRGPTSRSRKPIKLNLARVQSSRRLSRISKAINIPEFSIQPNKPVRRVDLIETLTLDFQFDESRYGYMPIESKHLLFVFGLLVRSSAIRLKTISHDGCLYQEILDRIAVLPSLRELHLRRTRARYGCASYEES